MNNDHVTKTIEEIDALFEKARDDYFKELIQRVEQDWSKDLTVGGSVMNRFDSDILDSIRYSTMYLPIDETVVTETTCKHDMKEYIGLTNSFSYCTKCDHKESI